ncbi:MAG: hypothetical protein ACXWKP_02305 [Bradyrhizobium sp.]
MVLNVVKFPKKAARFRWSATRPAPEAAVADISGLVSQIQSLQSKAKTDLRDAILLLDLAAQHARQLVKTISDPTLRKRLEDDLTIIEELLLLARDKTLHL